MFAMSNYTKNGLNALTWQMWAFWGYFAPLGAIAWYVLHYIQGYGVQGKTALMWCGSMVPGGGLRIPSEHPGVRGWPGVKLLCPYRLEKFSKILAAFRGSSVAMPGKRALSLRRFVFVFVFWIDDYKLYNLDAPIGVACFGWLLALLPGDDVRQHRNNEF